MRRQGATLGGASAAAILIGACAALAAPGCGSEGTRPIAVGAKNFTEQRILGECLAQIVEEGAGLPVIRRFDLGGTFVCHRALVAGELDMYVEYTGTALGAILEQPVPSPRERVLETVRTAYEDRFGCTWLSPIGFDNTFALVVRPGDALTHGLASISDLAHVADRFRAGFGYEFIERADGWPGLSRAYGFDFAQPPREMDLGLLYRALVDGEVDVVAGSATDGPIDALGLVVLEDDRAWFPPYDAVPVVREETLRRHPELGPLIHRLAGTISQDRMRRMNHAVDGEGRPAAEVAREFLREQGLIP